MSFASTPLGQDRRLDHQTFLKGPSFPLGNTNNPPKRLTHPVPISYAYGYVHLSNFFLPRPCLPVTDLAHVVLLLHAGLQSWLLLRAPSSHLPRPTRSRRAKARIAKRKTAARVIPHSNSVTRPLPTAQVRLSVRESSPLRLSRTRPRSTRLQLI